MATLHEFGGNWTEEKLQRLEKYLKAYMKIFSRNKWASRYTTYYVDAFAGTGSRASIDDSSPTTLDLFDAEDVQAVQRLYRGSAQIALEIEPSFDHFLFIEKNSEYVVELENLKVEYPAKADQISIQQEDANRFLQRWCEQMSWRRNRAVIFLDPYGMSVDWTTIETIAKTKAVDLWILLPVGLGINRLLTRSGLPNDAWANKLTRFFGTDEWIEAFYTPPPQPSLFPIEEEFEKKANFESIGEFFQKRLETVFAEVSENSLALLNSKNNPLYLLYFAASNPIGAPTAVKIARDILGK